MISVLVSPKFNSVFTAAEIAPGVSDGGGIVEALVVGSIRCSDWLITELEIDCPGCCPATPPDDTDEPSVPPTDPLGVPACVYEIKFSLKILKSSLLN